MSSFLETIDSKLEALNLQVKALERKRRQEVARLAKNKRLAKRFKSEQHQQEHERATIPYSTEENDPREYLDQYDGLGPHRKRMALVGTGQITLEDAGGLGKGLFVRARRREVVSNSGGVVRIRRVETHHVWGRPGDILTVRGGALWYDGKHSSIPRKKDKMVTSRYIQRYGDKNMCVDFTPAHREASEQKFLLGQTDMGCLGFANHSDTPNIQFEAYRDYQLVFARIISVIRIGDQLTVDYGSSYFSAWGIEKLPTK